MKHSVNEIGTKLNALNLWNSVLGQNWALKPRGVALPYFSAVVAGDGNPVKARLLLLEGWQTFADYVRMRGDQWFGYCTSPIELPHFELVVLADGSCTLLRHDPGYMPIEGNPRQCEFASRLLWESYGIMLRLESDPRLMMKYSESQSVFARVEIADGKWEDRPLEIPPAHPIVEKVSFDKRLLAKAKDLKIAAGEAIEIDFRLQPNLMTKERRPRTIYELVAADAATGAMLFTSRTSVAAGSSIKSVWESMPQQVLAELVRLGRLPGDIRVRSGRVFRLLRYLGMELPFKLSMHEKLSSGI